MVNVPRLVIAAPASGSGKTTIATGLMRAFTDAGLAVSPHKVGPDYIDPGYHALATGRPGRNLDAYMCGPERIAPLFLHGAAGCDLALVEGVMGLYDGASGQGELASTAHVAKLLKAPVVLVVDASSQSRSVAALVHGFASWDPEVRVAGVILNKVGSDRHEHLLREALEESGVPVLGAVRRVRTVDTPSRHLGLVPVAERRPEAVAAVAAQADQVRAGCDLRGLLALAHSAPPLADSAWSPESFPSPAPSRNRGSAPDPARVRAGGPATPPEWGSGGLPPTRRSRESVQPGRGGAGEQTPAARPVVALAGGPAFTFSYAEHTELLTAAGAEVVTFDPLRDEELPPDTAALVIGGGFPEMHAAELSANDPLRKAVAALAETGAPIAAECAGLLYLSRSLDGKPMCGVLPADARMSERLTLGYREAVAIADNPLAAAGTRVRGHEFHRTVVEPGTGATPAWGMTHPERRTEGFVQGGVHASYLHTHWAGSPGTAHRFVAGLSRR
ncbi:cobyrinate a,c-diamide synthase [Streptomyces olivoreticuli]|uniref:cobyrinate a,c-diamide synthase n=1 Tax=Streptomyces olivoreticuli TaxID=68246 RepID=UPI000E2533E2|nr:cobyrinate a,c-diamide synthase [Streptomyces olivoreticuli]